MQDEDSNPHTHLDTHIMFIRFLLRVGTVGVNNKQIAQGSESPLKTAVDRHTMIKTVVLDQISPVKVSVEIDIHLWTDIRDVNGAIGFRHPVLDPATHQANIHKML